jgi:hypothetical protein
MHLRGLNPVHIDAGRLQFFNKGLRARLDAAGEFNGDEGADALHGEQRGRVEGTKR